MVLALGEQISSKTKIVVLHLKELIYTGIFIVLGILFIILLFIMFRSDKETPEETPDTPQPETQEQQTPEPVYQPGTYRSALYLEDETVEINLTVDETQIVSLTLTPPGDKISTLYPLLEPSFNALSAQIRENQSLENITYPEESTYTSELLLEVIGDTLAKIQAP